MHRPTLGAVALLCLALGGVVLWAGQGDATQSSSGWGGALLRVGLMLGALWLALPEVQRIPNWLYGVILCGGIVLALRPRYFLLAVGMALALALLRPRLGGSREIRRRA